MLFRRGHMITSDNYQRLMLEYRVLKQLAKDALPVGQFVHEINTRSTIGMKFLNFFERLTDGGDVAGAVKDFIDVVYGVKCKIVKKSKLIKTEE